MLDFDQFEVLSFDCYGTLIDWESGILNSLKPVLAAHHIELADQQILELYGKQEAKQEHDSYVTYREVLSSVMQAIADELGFEPSASELEQPGNTLKDWPAFPDAPAALAMLKQKYKLAIISNIDNDLFAESNKHLKVEFDWIISAEKVRSYKPALRHFEVALEEFGVGLDKQLHIAQSLYHDIGPANKFGLTSVWVNRRHHKEGGGATPQASGTPDLEVPDLQSLVSMMGLAE